MYRTYGAICFIVILPVVILVNMVAWYGLQKYSNDLTRIGGFLEEDYGWSGFRQKFSDKLLFENNGDYSDYTDLVVMGDSFSHKDGSSWVMHFANASGYSAQVMHHSDGGVERIVESELFKAEPPKLVVYQIVERSLQHAFIKGSDGCDTKPSEVPFRNDFVPMGLVLENHSRDVQRQRGDFQLAINYLSSKIFLVLGQPDKIKAREVLLTRDDLFSNRKKDHLLYFEHDLVKGKWPEVLRNKIQCSLQAFREKIEANGKTAVVIMLVPDKLSAYSPWIVDEHKDIAMLSVLDTPEIKSISNAVDLHAKIITELENGFVDFYSPSDTHWSSQGDFKVAQWLQQSLTRYRD